MKAARTAPSTRFLLVLVLTGALGGQLQARYLQHLQNIGLSYGAAFRSPALGLDQSWELSYDRLLRTCMVRKPFWGAAITLERRANDPGMALSARFAMSPYRRYVSRRVHFTTLMSMRVGRWTGAPGIRDFIRPEVGFQLMGINSLITPKITVLYGREVRVGGGLEDGLRPLPSGVCTVQAGISLNLGTLAHIRRLKSEREQGKSRRPRTI